MLLSRLDDGREFLKHKINLFFCVVQAQAEPDGPLGGGGV